MKEMAVWMKKNTPGSETILSRSLRDSEEHSLKTTNTFLDTGWITMSDGLAKYFLYVVLVVKCYYPNCLPFTLSVLVTCFILPILVTCFIIRDSALLILSLFLLFTSLWPLYKEYYTCFNLLSIFP